MVLKKFIGWIIGWIKNQLRSDIKLKKAGISYVELEKKTKELEKLIEHMSAENEEIQLAFFRNIYHEIRTPMNSILGFSSLLHNENLTAEKRSVYTDQVWKSSVVFLQLIDDLVEASLLEARKTQLEPVWFPMNEMLQELYQASNRHRHIMDKTNIVLLLNKSSFTENIYAETDRKKLLQMLECLITDCVMGMDRGIVEIGYRPILNNGLSFFIKTSCPGNGEPENEHVVRRVSMGSSNYGLQLRKRVADRLIGLFGCHLKTEHNSSGGYTLRIVISPVNTSNTQIITECKSNNKKIAI
ncbi:MAG: HAMP domain-containing histidine kinase [Bacteroidales bacterium]|nr:HAMP domain-containing histidine kinase [Bacteroidales bacterium]